MPALTRGCDQLPPRDIEFEATRKLVNVRIHVERIIQAVRQHFQILSATGVSHRLASRKGNGPTVPYQNYWGNGTHAPRLLCSLPRNHLWRLRWEAAIYPALYWNQFLYLDCAFQGGDWSWLESPHMNMTLCKFQQLSEIELQVSVTSKAPL